MDHLTIKEKNVVERYLMRQLTPADAELFEEHYLDCPDCLEKLELSKQLHRGLRDVAAEDGTTLVRSAVLAWFARRGQMLRTGLAIAVLALAILPWMFLAPEVSRLSDEHARLEGELAQALSPQVRTPVYTLGPERSGSGAEPSTRITLGPNPEWVVLALQLPPSQGSAPSGASYRARLREVEGEILWESGGIEPSASGRVTLSVHSSWLEALSYAVELDASASDAGGDFLPVAHFAFGVRRDR